MTRNSAKIEGSVRLADDYNSEQFSPRILSSAYYIAFVSSLLSLSQSLDRSIECMYGDESERKDQ